MFTLAFRTAACLLRLRGAASAATQHDSSSKQLLCVCTASCVLNVHHSRAYATLHLPEMGVTGLAAAAKASAYSSRATLQQLSGYAVIVVDCSALNYAARHRAFRKLGDASLQWAATETARFLFEAAHTTAANLEHAHLVVSDAFLDA